MMKYLAEEIKKNMSISKSEIELPTGNALITDVEYVTESDRLTGAFYRVNGIICPVDPQASNIRFQAGLPEEWNGKLVQYGGGGLDGSIAPVEVRFENTGLTTSSVMEKGYAVIACDGGHEADPDDPESCEWALNNESYLNYCVDAQKKTHDVAVFLLKKAYGSVPKRVYYCGGSNGGRECMKSIQMYGKDYDGAVCNFPVLYYVQKVLADIRNIDALQDLGPDAWIDLATCRKIEKTVIDVMEAAGIATDGIIGDYEAAKAKENEVIAALSEFLNEKQMAWLKIYASSFSLDYPLAFGKYTYPGYGVFCGAPLAEICEKQFGENPVYNVVGSKPSSREVAHASDQVLKCMIMGDREFEPSHFDYHKYQEQVVKASERLNADTDDLDDFYKHGGKLLMFQGLADQLVPADGTIDYYKKLKEKYKDELKEFLRFYLVPGYGHGMSAHFWLDIPVIDILDQWVETGKAPEMLVAADDTSEGKKTRPLYPYPGFAAYTGSGDVNQAENYYNGGMKGKGLS